MGRTRKPTLQDLNPNATAVEEVVKTSLYWFGMLPAQKPFKIKKPCRDKNKLTNDYYEYVETTSEELWSGDVNQWVGQCPWRQSLSVNGFSFDAFTETLMRPVGTQGTGNFNKVSWPGVVREMDEETFKQVINQCYRHVIRVGRDGKGSEINLDQPKSYQQFDNGVEQSVKEAYNPKTDTFFAHYVYLVKLEADPEQYEPETYYRLALAWAEFFKESPKSVAQMYPRQIPTVKAPQASP